MDEASTPSGGGGAAVSTTPTAAPRTGAASRGGDGTPLRRALSAEPSSRLRASAALRTPGSHVGAGGAFRASQQRPGPLSASARRTTLYASTPHGRQALAAREARRALFSTPGLGRRRSIRDQRDTPRNVLRALAARLAPTSRPLTSSSSSPPGAGPGSGRGGRRGARGASLAALPEADSDDDIPIDRPRLSLPIGADSDDDDDDDSDLQPPRSSGLEDDNLTAHSLELPRRALSEQPADRYSIRMSDFSYAAAQDDDGEDEGGGDPFRGEDAVGLESGLFPPMHFDDAAYDRADSEADRRETLAGRPSDFGALEAPMEGNESTVLLAPQVQESPGRADEAWPSDEGFPAGHDEDDDDDDDEDDGDGDGDVGEPEARDAAAAPAGATRRPGKRPGKKRSKYGIEYPSLPAGVVKRLAQTFAQTSGVRRPKIGPDTLAAIRQASEWFFEQLGDDLRAYADHARRRTIDESDVATLMRRQRQTSPSTTPFSLAQRHLPRELLQELRMPPPVVARQKRRGGRAGRGEDEDGEEEVT